MEIQNKSGTKNQSEQSERKDEHACSEVSIG